MTAKYRFVDCFWETDFNGTLGFDLLCKRIKDGHKMCKDIEDFFRKKAKAESQYSKTIRNLARSVEGKEDSGESTSAVHLPPSVRSVDSYGWRDDNSYGWRQIYNTGSTQEKSVVYLHHKTIDRHIELGHSWQELKFQTERTARFHEDANTELNKLADEIAKFSEQMKIQSKQAMRRFISKAVVRIREKNTMEDKVKEGQKAKRTTHAKLLELQRSYREKCRELVQSESQFEVAKQTVSASTRDIEKLKVRADRSREAVEKADGFYKYTVDLLEQARQEWESDTEVACELFQRQEEERIYVLRDCLWRCTNVDSQLSVDSDESSATVRSCLEKCDVNEDINEFAKNNMTGKTRPVPILYENYFEGTTSLRRNGRVQASPAAERRRPPPPSTPVPPVPGGDNSAEYSTIYSVAK